ncbi:RNA polymerase sigma-70 factor (ECF subfamily) [Nocardioides sp. BE266]|uniref:RNA polymerase sigma factor n=1 Tax=Nocardioides sp. BE266 TaxID=2817725 RepID=UPI0028649754|nr:RNA polymerase sigma factor [Nocardioides sp. BE266]MDR7255450.1 RNA polymerase sigma-70 factor (ECF subfamily) [Nocardioides sp. BE266]
MRAGDTDAYAVLVRRHAPMAMRTAVLLGAGGDAEDVVQEALVKAYRSLDRFRTDRPFRPWLLRIVANETRNAHRGVVRRSAREERATTSLPPELIDPAAEVADREEKERLLAAVQRLPEAMGRVVVCRCLLDLDEASTAVVLGVPRGTVKSRLSRGLKRLREELGSTREEVDHA